MASKSTKSPRPTQTSRVSRFSAGLKKRWAEYAQKKPHRSFRRTYRRDYERSLEIPGYVSLTKEVVAVLRENAKLFGGLVAVYTGLVALFVGFASQDTYSNVRDLLNESGQTLLSGGWGSIGKAFLLLGSGWRGTFLPELTDAQQIYNSLLIVFVWLTTIWLLRSVLSGNNPKLRDGLYSSGAPFVPTTLLSLVLLVQLAPLALALIGYQAAVSTGILDGGIEAMIFWIVAALMVLLSLYWASATIMAMVIVTLPGMYPWRALQTGSEMVMGRRLRLLLRIVWLIVILGLVWVVLVVPAIILDNWLASVLPFWSDVPFVPIILLFVSTVTTLFSASYVYMLYRKVVEYDSANS